jgi:putative redox protein
VGVDSTDHGFVISYGAADDGIGVKPSDLLLLALGVCSAFNVPAILLKKHQKLTGLEVRVTAENEEAPPWT